MSEKLEHDELDLLIKLVRQAIATRQVYTTVHERIDDILYKLEPKLVQLHIDELLEIQL